MELEKITKDAEIKEEVSGFKRLYRSAKLCAVTSLVTFGLGLYVGAQNPVAVNNIVKNANDLKNTVVSNEPIIDKALETTTRPYMQEQTQGNYGGK